MPCNANGTFVTLAAGDQAVVGALCLKHQMRRMNSTCPLHIVVEDRPGREMTDRSLTKIKRAYGADRVIAMSTLIGHARTEGLGRRLIKDTFGAAASTSKYWLWAWPERVKLAYLDTDVLLLRNIDEMLDVELTPRHPFAAVPSCTSAKIGWFNGGVLVFMPSLATLHRLQGLDRWTHYPWKGYIGRGNWADICAPFDGCTKPQCLAARTILDGKFFNGTDRSEPAPVVRRKKDKQLVRVTTSDPFKACRFHFNGSFHPAGRIQLACEPRYTDQTILNYAFPHYLQMPKSFNMVRQARYDEPCVSPMNTSERRATCRYGFKRAAGVAIIHALGEPKPWSKKLSLERLAELRRQALTGQALKTRSSLPRERITALWQKRCGHFRPETPGVASEVAHA